MNLGLIAGQSAKTLKKIITENFDSIQVYDYNSIGKFVHETTTRARTLDRIIIVYDVFDVENPLLLITQLNDYLYANYTTARIITLGKTKDHVLKELIDENLMMPKMINLCKDKVSPRMICDLASLTQVELEKAYGEQPAVETPVADPQPIPVPITNPVVPPVVAKPNEKKKKKPWGLFGKKPKGTEDENIQGEDEEESEAFDPTDSSFKFDMGGDTVQEEHPNVPAEAPIAIPYDDEDEYELSHEELELELPDFDSGNDEPEDDFELPDWSGSAALEEPVEDEEDETDNEFEVDTDDEVNTTPFTLDEGFEVVGTLPEETSFEIDFELPEIPATPSTDVVVERIPHFTNQNLEQVDIDELSLDMSTNLNNEIDIYGEEGDTEAYAVNTNIKNKIEELKHRNHSTDTQVEGVHLEHNAPVQGVQQEKLTEITDNEEKSSFDLWQLEEDYEQTNKPKVIEVQVEKVIEVQVERIVEVEKIVEKIVPGLSNNSRAYRNGVRSVILTGDRRSGVTRNALNIAGLFAAKSSTLFVDMDIERRGALGYMGFTGLLSDEEHVQHSLKYYEKPESLYYLVHHYEAGGFDALLTIYGSDVTDAHLSNAQKLLSGQNNYKTIVIDCPLEKLHLLKDIILYSEVVFTCEANKGGVLNLLQGLDKFTEDSNFNTFLYKNANFLVTRGKDVTEFTKELLELTEYFSIDETNHNWAKTPVLGTESQIKQIVERL